MLRTVKRKSLLILSPFYFGKIADKKYIDTILGACKMKVMINEKDNELMNYYSATVGKLLSGEASEDKADEFADVMALNAENEITKALSTLFDIREMEIASYGNSGIFVTNNAEYEVQKLWAVIEHCREIERGEFYSKYRELIEELRDSKITLEYIRTVVQMECERPNDAWQRLTNAINNTKYDKIISEIKPLPKWNLKWYQCNDIYTDGEIEDDIINDVLKNDTDYYSEVIAERNDWPTYYHLTHIRKNILNWYPFSGKERVLEIGCGMGAITGLLCEKCESVTAVEISKQRATATLLRNRNRNNLEIIVGNLNDIEFEDKFDVITLIGVFEYQGRYTANEDPYNDFLLAVKKLLAPGGKMLIAIENKCGLKYWCGAREDHVGFPFAGINQYRYIDQGIQTFSHKELDDMLAGAGFGYRYFYYPLPDYKLPLCIFSQDCLPEAADIDSLSFYYAPDSSTLVADEKKLYKDVIENGAFEFMANSFLVECSVEIPAKEEKIIYSSFASYRLPKYQIGTSICSDGRVYKYALRDEGKGHISSIPKYAKLLNQNDLMLLPVEEENGILNMDYISEPTAEAVLLNAYKNKDKDLVFSIFDDIYECILSSSEECSEESDILRTVTKTAHATDFGPILKYGFLDMCAQNAFVTKKGLLWFDQEWVMQNVPAKYILFRGLIQFYNNHSASVNGIPIEVLLERYDLDKNWSELVKLENIFTVSIIDLNYQGTKAVFENATDSGIVQNITSITDVVSKSKLYESIKGRLYTPTYINKIDDTYFIVDCWHDRVLFSDSIEKNIEKWMILDNRLRHPHSIIGLGDILITEDTENNRLCIYSKKNHKKVEEIYCEGRPHKLVNNPKKANVALCILSEAQSILELKINGGTIVRRTIKISDGEKYPYIRSIGFVKDELWAFTAQGEFIQLDEDNDYKVMKKFTLPKRYAGINDAIWYEGKVYVSIYTDFSGEVMPTLLVSDSLELLSQGKFAEIYDTEKMKGVPYYFTSIDERLFIPEIDVESRIVSYAVGKNGFIEVDKNYFDFGKPLLCDIRYNNLSY